jgi:hypothetical protein
MQVIYLLPWLVLLLLIVLGAIVSTHTFRHLSQRNHAPEMFDTALFGHILSKLSPGGK